MQLLSPLFCHKIKLSWEQHYCWEWGEWTWWIQHHLLNICYSALLPTVHEEICSMKIVIRETAFKTQHNSIVCRHFCITNWYFNIPVSFIILSSSSNIQYIWLPLEPSLQPQSSKYLIFNTNKYSQKIAFKIKNF